MSDILQVLAHTVVLTIPEGKSFGYHDFIDRETEAAN